MQLQLTETTRHFARQINQKQRGRDQIGRGKVSPKEGLIFLLEKRKGYR